MIEKRDYKDFEDRYRKRKSEGKPGWTDKSDYKHKYANIDRILSSEYAPKNGRFLELGCGSGLNTLYLAKKGFDVYGIDIVSTAIGWAKENAKKHNLKANFKVGNVVYLKGYNDNYFDFVLDGNCFHYITSDNRNLFLKNVYRILKSGGFFHVSTSYGNDKFKKPFIQNNLSFYPVSHDIFKDGVPYGHAGLYKDILDEIRKVRFKILHWEITKEGGPKADKDKLPFMEEGELKIDSIKL